MEKQQLMELQKMLAERRRGLREVLAGNRSILQAKISPDAGEMHMDFNHPADMVGPDPDYDKEIQLIGLAEEELTLIDEALLRIDEGTYGQCAHCEDEISYPRLRAIPYTRFCIDCQRQLEKRPA